MQKKKDLPKGLSFEFLESADSKSPSPVSEYLSVMKDFTLGGAFREKIKSTYRGKKILDDKLLQKKVRVDLITTQVQVERLYAYRLDLFCDPYPPFEGQTILTGKMLTDLARVIGSANKAASEATKQDKTKSHKEVSSLGDALSYLASFAPPRITGPSLTQNHQVYICGLEQDEYKSRDETLRHYIYSLLFAQPEFASKETMNDFLDKNRWSPVDFFELYHQNAAIVAVSKKYPANIYKDNIGYFTDSNVSTSPEGLLRYKEIVQTSGQVLGNNYDTLPEYPPLKYLVYPINFFGAFHEEVLRFSLADLIEVRRRSASFVWPIGAVYSIVAGEARVRRIEMAMAQLLNLDNLKLPVLGEFIDAIPMGKLVEQLHKSISDLKSSNLNSTMQFLTIISLIIGTVSVMIGIIKL